MLKSRNLFVDTQAFHQHKFRFDHPTLKRLLELGEEEKIQLILTETVVGEVKAQLKDQLSEAYKSLGQFYKSIAPLESGLPESYKGLLLKPSEDELIGLGLKAWESYLKESNAIIVPASAVDSGELLSYYFKSLAPFSSGRKKNEFPDAISVLSLDAWLKSHEENIYIVSHDSDLVAWCEKNSLTIHLNSLSEYIDLFNRAEENLTYLVHKLLGENSRLFLDAIKSHFLEGGFEYDDNWDSEVSNVEVNDISFVGFNVINVDEIRAVVDLSVQIEFTAQINGSDYQNGVWDSEDKKYVYVPEFSFEHEFNEVYDVSIEFSFLAEAEEFCEILSIEFDNGGSIVLHIDDGYPYK